MFIYLLDRTSHLIYLFLAKIHLIYHSLIIILKYNMNFPEIIFIL